MRILKTKWLARFTRKEKISDQSLIEAIDRAERGIIDADLGDGLIKQRVARDGQGRSGGYRMLIGYRAKDRAVFVYGFAKNDRENITDEQLHSLRAVATEWLEASAERLNEAFDEEKLQEIENG